MNQEQVRELLELLRQISQTLERIEALLTGGLGPAARREQEITGREHQSGFYGAFYRDD